MILLVYPQNSPFFYHKSTPLSILTIGSFLESKGIEVEYFDERIHSKKLFKKLLKKNPELIGISSMTSHQISSALALAKIARAYRPHTPLLWGGVHATMFIEQTLASPYVDYIIQNEGEWGLYEFVLWLRGEGELKKEEIKGLCFKDAQGKITINQERPFLDIETLPNPYTGKAALILEEYLQQKNSLPNIAVELSRGCPYHCTFCYNTFFNKETTRIKSAEKMRQELTYLKERFGLVRIQYCDDTLCGGYRKRIIEMCEVTQSLGLSWESSAPVNIINEQMVQVLEKGNCECIFFGIESGDEEVLKKFGKGANVARNNKAIELMSKSHIDVTYSLITGHPWESDEIFYKTLDYADQLHRLHPRAGMAIQPYLPLPGTRMYQSVVEMGFRPPQELKDWARYTHDENIYVPWISAKRSKELRAIYLISFMAFRFERKVRGSILTPLYYFLHKFSLWRWHRRFFSFYVEAWPFKIYKRLGKYLMLLERKRSHLPQEENIQESPLPYELRLLNEKR